MANYIDGFVFPIALTQIDEYRQLSSDVAAIWLEYGALKYQEFIADGSTHAQTLSFRHTLNPKSDETIIMGFIAFDSVDTRNSAHEHVTNDSRMKEIMSKYQVEFEPERMAFGGFDNFISIEK